MRKYPSIFAASALALLLAAPAFAADQSGTNVSGLTSDGGVGAGSWNTWYPAAGDPSPANPQTLFWHNSARVQTNLTADQNIFANVDLTVGRNAVIGQNLTVNANQVVGGTQIVVGAARFDSTLTAFGATTLNNRLTVAQQAQLNSTLAVAGATTVSGATSLGSTLSVGGTSTFGGLGTFQNGLNVTGQTSTGTLRVSSTAEVAGVAVLRGGAQVASYIDNCIFGCGWVRSGTFYHNSDERRKTDFQRVDGRSILARLNGYSFTWKDTGKPDQGVKAQEVLAVAPELVLQDDPENYSVNYDGLFAAVIEAQKSDMADLDALKAENATLRAQVNDLTARLQKIEAKFAEYP